MFVYLPEAMLQKREGPGQKNILVQAKLLSSEHYVLGKAQMAVSEAVLSYFNSAAAPSN